MRACGKVMLKLVAENIEQVTDLGGFNYYPFTTNPDEADANEAKTLLTTQEFPFRFEILLTLFPNAVVDTDDDVVIKNDFTKSQLNDHWSKNYFLTFTEHEEFFLSGPIQAWALQEWRERQIVLSLPTPTTLVQSVLPSEARDDAKPTTLVQSGLPSEARDDANPIGSAQSVLPSEARDEANPTTLAQSVLPSEARDDAKPTTLARLLLPTPLDEDDNDAFFSFGPTKDIGRVETFPTDISEKKYRFIVFHLWKDAREIQKAKEYKPLF